MLGINFTIYKPINNAVLGVNFSKKEKGGQERVRVEDRSRTMHCTITQIVCVYSTVSARQTKQFAIEQWCDYYLFTSVTERARTFLFLFLRLWSTEHIQTAKHSFCFLLFILFESIPLLPHCCLLMHTGTQFLSHSILIIERPFWYPLFFVGTLIVCWLL